MMPVPKAPQGDPKSGLASLCQRLTKRAALKTDIEYSTAQYGAQFQATVKLNCFNGEAYAGQLENNAKDAEKSAAQHALADLDPTYKIMPLSALNQQKAPAGGAGAGMQKPPKLGGAGPTDTKSNLNSFCQQYIKRPITKLDIVYTTQKYGMQYQATVQLNCISGAEYAGHLCGNPKDAEKSAAEQALQAHATDIAQLPTTKRKVTAGMGGGVAPMLGEMGGGAITPAAKKQKMASAAGGADSCVTAKTQLNSLAMKLAKRALKKGETVYECMQVEGGFQATVALSALPGEYGGVVWAGQVQPTKQAAEQSAAEIALEQLTADPTVAAECTPAPKQGGGKGKGKGKGKGFDWFGFAWAQGPSQSELPRTRVSEEVLKGEMAAWMSFSNYGWIKPEVAVDHPAAKIRDGKIYVNKRDLAEGSAAKMNKGVQVTFKLFEDPSGLGAEEVTVV